MKQLTKSTIAKLCQKPSVQELSDVGEAVRTGVIRGSYTKTLKNRRNLGAGEGRAGRRIPGLLVF